MLRRLSVTILFGWVLFTRIAADQTLVVGETPAGATNGSNAVFTLQNSPSLSTTVALYKNGLRQKTGADYFVTGNKITFLGSAIPLTGDVVVADYVMQGQPSSTFAYSRAITINHTQIPHTDQANFPVLVSGVYPFLATSSNGGHVQNASGYDIVFASDPAGQNLLNWEVESYNAITGNIAIWVQLPSISHATDTVFYMLYGNARITTPQGNASATWDSSFRGVYHLSNGPALSVKDSTSNANHGGTTNVTFTPGQIDGAANLIGFLHYITMGNVLDIGASDVTLSAWIKPPNENQASTFLSKRQNSAPWPQYDFGVGSLSSGGTYVPGKTLFCAFLSSSLAGGAQFYHTQNNVVDGNWHHATCTRSSSGVAIYVDGVNQPLVADIGNQVEQNTTNASPFNLGYQNDFVTFFVGAIDEVRVSNITRSADWIMTEYNNQNSPSTFYTVGNEAAGAARVRFITNESQR